MCCECCQYGDRLKGKGTSSAIHHRMRDFGEVRFPDDWMQEDQKCIQICQALLEKKSSYPRDHRTSMTSGLSQSVTQTLFSNSLKLL